MSARATLKRAKALIVAGARDLYRAIELSAETHGEVLEALEQLEAQACPARPPLVAAIMRYLDTRADADGLRAVELSRVPGADQSLWNWIHEPGRKRRQVLELFDRAILKPEFRS